MRTKRPALLVSALFAALTAALLLPAEAAAAGRPAEPELVATGLQGTSGATIGPDGALYATEALLGQVTRIDPRTGETSVYASGLPARVIGLGGAIDVAFVGRTAYVLVTVVGADVGGDQVSGVYRVDGPAAFTVVADLGAFSVANPPDYPVDLPQGLQFALEPYRGGFLVTDGHHNRVLRVARDGEVSAVLTLGNVVPTGLAVSGRTVVYAEAGPVPHLPATGRVMAFEPRSPQPRELASGYSLLVDVEFGRCGTLYALSQGDSPGEVPAGSPALPDSGELLRVNADGMLTVVADGLDLPTSVDFARDTAYVTTTTGDVYRITDVSGGRGGHYGTGGGCRDHRDHRGN
jgi:sugar lactone lactonase YvrE